MLEILGKDYLIDHCVSFLISQNKEHIYRSYVTEALKIISENTSKFFGGGYLNIRYTDILENINKPKETRTAEEIIENIRDKLINLDAEEV